MRRPRGSATKAVLDLCDGTMTGAQIATRTGLTPEYVRTVLQRNPEANVKRIRDKSGVLRGHLPRLKSELRPTIGVTLMISGETYRAIRDHAETAGVGLSDVVSRLLAIAVEVGDLDTHFPVGSAPE